MINHVDICLPNDVISDIKKRRKIAPFNLSKYVVQCYKNDFLDDVVLIKRYNETMKQALGMKKEIEKRKSQRNQEEEEYKQILHNNPKLEIMELRFLVSVKRKIDEDEKYLDPNFKRYCNTFRYIPKETFIKKLNQINLSQCENVPEYREYQSHEVKIIVRK